MEVEYQGSIFTTFGLRHVLFTSTLFSKNATMDDNVHRFLDWFRQHGGYWHESLQPSKGEPSAERVLISSLTTCMADSTYGLHFTTRTPLAANTKVIACPASLVITREAAIAGLQGLGADEDALKGLNERQLVAGYVTAHFAVGLDELRRESR